MYNTILCEQHYTCFSFVPVTEGTLSLWLCHYLLLLFYCLVWGYYSDCSVDHVSGVSWYILHYVLQWCLKSTKRINSVFFAWFLFFFFQVMNSVSCGKRHNANFLTIFIFFFVLQSLGQERGQRFCKDQGRWLWLLFACKFSNSHHQFLYVTVIN